MAQTWMHWPAPQERRGDFHAQEPFAPCVEMALSLSGFPWEGRMNNLAAQFEQDMRADSADYTRRTKTNPSRYLQMIAEKGGVETARRLALDPKFHEGFTRAWEFKCLELTAEYLMTFARGGLYRTLFSSTEIAAAERKLRQVEITGPISE